MDSPLLHKIVQIKKSTIHGYGVFAEQPIAKDDVIEECHVIPIHNEYPDLCNYLFASNKIVIFPLGNGCLYNHSMDPNADFLFDNERLLLCFTALRPINKGEEILIYYGDEWFNSRNMKIKKQSFASKLRQFISSIAVLLRATLVAAALFGLIHLLQLVSPHY